MSNVEESLKKMVRIFRKECHRVLESERTTIRGPDEMLIALQLTMAEINKQERGEFGVALSDVLLCWRCLLLDRLQLPSEGCRRPDNYEPIRREYEVFLKRTNTLDLIDVYIMTKQLTAEELLTPEQLLQFISGGVSEEDPVETTQMPPCPSTPSSQPRPCTAQMCRVVRRVLCSYLCLLVNSKDDLALAVSMDTPGRALGRTAFTDLKHAARSGQTSLFLAVTSFVRAIQLGGKGYAPPEDHPLRRHLKGLGEYVTFTDHLEEILGDTPEPSVSCGKLLSRMRSALLKGRSSGEGIYGAVEETTAALREQISLLHTRRREEETLTTGISPARPKAYAVNHGTAYMGRATVKLILELLDQEALAPPCRNKAELLTEDQAMLTGEEGHTLIMLYRSPEVVTGESPKPLRSRVQAAHNKDKQVKRGAGLRSQFACTYVEEEDGGDDLPLNRVLDFPSTSQLPTCKHPAPKRNTHTSHTADTLHPHTTPEDQEQPAHKETSHKLNPAPVSAALGSRPGNTKPRPAKDAQRKKSKKGDAPSDRDAPPTVQGGKKSVKRKQVEVEGADEVCGDENQAPPAKKVPPRAPAMGPPGKKPSSSSSSKAAKKLIAGQGKLTSFFRL